MFDPYRKISMIIAMVGIDARTYKKFFPFPWRLRINQRCSMGWFEFAEAVSTRMVPLEQLSGEDAHEVAVQSKCGSQVRMLDTSQCKLKEPFD
jgi:hypothetical protein